MRASRLASQGEPAPRPPPAGGCAGQASLLPLADPSLPPPALPPPPQIFLRFGTPALRPFPAALAPWMQGIAVSTEFFHLLLATLMVRGGTR